MSDSLKNRDSSFDAFRGIAIIAVVAIHAIPWRFYQVSSVLSYRPLLNFAVPAFLFISGYWISKKPIRYLGDYTDFLRKRFLRIFVPYLIWSLVFIGYEGIKSNDISIAQILYKLLIGRAYFHFYFVIVIAQLYLLTPILQYLNRKHYGFALVLVFNIITLTVLYYFRLRDIRFSEESYYLIHNPFLSWVFFYQVGLLVGSRNGQMFALGNRPLLILVAVFVSLALSIIEAIVLLSKFDNWQLAICALKYSSFLYSTCVIFGFLVLRERIRTWPRFLVILGEYSFGIYLMHMIILRGLDKILHSLNMLYSFQPLYEFIVVSMTLLICCTIIAVSRKFLPRPVYSKVLGF